MLYHFIRMKTSKNMFLLWCEGAEIFCAFDSPKLLQRDKIQQKNPVLLHNLHTQNVYIKVHFIFSRWAIFSTDFFNFLNSNYCDSFCLKYKPISLMLVTQKGVKGLSEGIKIMHFIFFHPCPIHSLCARQHLQLWWHCHTEVFAFIQKGSYMDNQGAWTTPNGMMELSSHWGGMMLCHVIIHDHRVYKMLLILLLILEAFVKASSCLQHSTKYKPTFQ